MAGGVILLKVVDIFLLNLVLPGLLDFVLSRLFSLIRESVLQELLLCRWHADPSSHSFITYSFPPIQTEALAFLTWSYSGLDFSSCVRWLKQSHHVIPPCSSFFIIVNEINLCHLCRNYFISISLWCPYLSDSQILHIFFITEISLYVFICTAETLNYLCQYPFHFYLVYVYSMCC